MFKRSVSTLLPAIALLLSLPKAGSQTPEPAWADTVLAITLIEEARQCHSENEHETVLEKAGQAFEIYTRLFGETHIQTAKSRMFVARASRYLSQEASALDLYKKSLPALEHARDTFLMVRCYQGIGLCLRGMYRFAEAQQALQSALQILRPSNKTQAELRADINLGIGSVYNAEKNYQAGIPFLENAHAAYTTDSIPIAIGYSSYHLGGAWFGLNDYARAKEYYLSALSDLKNELTPAHPYFADLYVKIGLCCQKTGDSETGLQHMLDAKAAYLKAGTETLDYIQFLKYLGEFYLNEGRYSEAITQLEHCLSAKEKEFGAQHLHLLNTLQLLGEAYLQNGQIKQAEACYRRGLQIINDSLEKAYPLQFRFYTKLAELRYAQGDFPGCMLYCDTAFTQAGFDPRQPENVLPRDYCRELCQLFARANFAQFQVAADTTALLRAEQYFALAAQILYREVEEITVKSSREIFYDRDHLLLQQWLDARMALFAATGNADHAEAAFQIAGRSKAFLLSEAMRQSGALHFSDVPDSILQAELSLRERIVAAEKQLEMPGEQSVVRIDSATLWLSRELSYWRKDYDDLLRRIETKYPEYFRLRQWHRDASNTDLYRNALAPNQALLMYSLTDKHCYAFVLNRDTFCAVILPFQPGLNTEIEKFKTSLTEYHSHPDPHDALYDRSQDRYLELAPALYRQLVQPLAGLLPERVLLIPDGKLWYLPFEALLSSRPTDAGNFRSYPYLGREKAISYGLSPEFLLQTSTPARRKPKKNWLGLAPFASTSENTSGTSHSTPLEQFIALPYSGKEVREIAALLQGDLWLDAESRPGRFQKEAALYRILHLATHSRADDRLGDYAYLATAASGEPLPAKDLYQLSLAAEMVVLSACEAGSGQLLRGEGIIGLVRAFTYAGAQSVVASLWVANDQSTASLMVNYYRNLRKGLPKDSALQNARLQLVDQFPAEAHPFFWAGFRVYGAVGPLW